MAVNVSKLWSDNKFLKISNNSKLLYIYLATNPNINAVGVISLNLNLVMLQLNLSLEEIREASAELVSIEYLYVKKVVEELYFIIPKHFNTVPKGDTAVLKVNKDLESLPESIVTFLCSIGISSDRKVITFKEPTPEEIMDYALSQGYRVDADACISFYRSKAKAYGKEGLWVDGRGKQVKDWKSKLRVVWFKDENKLKTVDGAPKGFESFYINFEGQQVFPEAWKDGRPYSKNMVVNKALQREYERRVSKI